MHILPDNARNSLASSRLFSKLNADQLEEILPLFEWLAVPAGDILFNAGDAADAVYIVISGRLKIQAPDTGHSVNTGELIQSDVFGELALVSKQSRTVGLRALRDSKLGKLSKLHFEQLLKDYPALTLELLQQASQWITQPGATVKHTNCNIIALHPLGEQAKVVEQFALQFKQSLSSNHTVFYLTQHQCEVILGTAALVELEHIESDEIGQTRLARWLEAQEKEYSYLILQANSSDSGWTRFCCQYADKILYLAPAELAPETLEFKKIQPPADSSELNAELILLHRRKKQWPFDTKYWLNKFQVNRHYHIRLYNPDDFARLSRLLSGQATGLVLGGGGAKSFGHIGVIRAMHELGIPIDRIGGTSMGAIIAAQYAAGYDAQALQQVNRKIWVDMRPHYDFTLPVTSLLAAQRAKRATRMVFANHQMEDLWLDCFCVSTDVTQMKPRIHHRGDIWSSLLASGAIPGVCSSIVQDESILVDGGVLDNLPVGVMRDIHQGPVLAVDPASTRGLKPQTTATVPPNGLPALLDYFRPKTKGKRYPNIFELIFHTSLLSSTVKSESSRALADCCLVLPKSKSQAMDMSAIDQLVEQGYVTAMAQLPVWLEEGKLSTISA